MAKKVVLIVNIIINYLVAAILAMFMGMGNAHLDDSYRLINIFIISLFVTPFITYKIINKLKLNRFKVLVYILSFTYFLWGYLLINLLAKPLEPIYNFDKYYLQKTTKVEIVEVNDKRNNPSGDREFTLILRVKSFSLLKHTVNILFYNSDMKLITNSTCKDQEGERRLKVKSGENLYNLDCEIMSINAKPNYAQSTLSDLIMVIDYDRRPNTNIFVPMLDDPRFSNNVN